eukprot:3373013-Prymnesium_polylepis.1
MWLRAGMLAGPPGVSAGDKTNWTRPVEPGRVHVCPASAGSLHVVRTACARGARSRSPRSQGGVAKPESQNGSAGKSRLVKGAWHGMHQVHFRPSTVLHYGPCSHNRAS